MATIKKKQKPIIRTVDKSNLLGKDGFELTWRDADKLIEFLSPRGRILAGQMTNLTVKQQKRLAKTIKQSRHLGLLPFTTQE